MKLTMATMRKITSTLLGLGLCISIGSGVGYLLTASYYEPFLNSSSLYAEAKVEDWASWVIRRGKLPGNCFEADLDDINTSLESMGLKRLESDPREELFKSLEPCVKELKLVEMEHYDGYAVSGIYRCESGGIMVLELRFTHYLEPRILPQEYDCNYGAYLKEWNVPAGEATMFPSP